MTSLIEFPTTFPIKVMGSNTTDFVQLVVSIIEKHAAIVTEGGVTRRLSRGDRFVSLTVYITAVSQEQLDAIYGELSAHERVLMLL